MPVLHDDRAGAKSGSRPDHGTEVMGISHLVEQDQAARPFGGFEHACDVLFLQRVNMNGEPLVDRFPGDDPRDNSRIGDLDGHLHLLRNRQDRGVRARGSEHFSALSRRIPQSRRRRMRPPEPKEAACVSTVLVARRTVSISVSGHCAASKAVGRYGLTS